jgi:multisubunit Na+/H+ antiporter MnhE subunit
MRWRYVAVLFAAFIVGLALTSGTTTKSVARPTGTMNILELQTQADKNLPTTLISDFI